MKILHLSGTTPHAWAIDLEPRLTIVHGLAPEVAGPVRAALDALVQARLTVPELAVSGLAGSQADDRGPQLIATILPDKLASMAVVQGVLGALLQRERSGRGRHVAVNMIDVAVSFLWPDVMRPFTFAVSNSQSPCSASSAHSSR